MLIGAIEKGAFVLPSTMVANFTYLYFSNNNFFHSWVANSPSLVWFGFMAHQPL